MTRAEATLSATRPAEQTLRLIPRLTRWAQARVVDDEEGPDLSLRQLSALQMIQDDETTTLGDVARRLMVTPAVVTGLIDRLEKRGYVRRIASTGDRRRVHLGLTNAGREAAAASERNLIDEVAAKLNQFSASELKTLEQGLTLLDRVVEDLESERTTQRR
jgi:DNA-binding MarR family transcriptional regulator